MTRSLHPFILSFLGMVAILGASCHRFSHSGEEESSSGSPFFIEITNDSGLNFVHEVGSVPLDQYFMPHIMGSGVALFDFDKDGRLDIYLIQNGGPHSQATNRLFHQGPDGRFTDVSKGSGLD